MDATPEKTISDIVTDFLSAAPTLEEIANYRLPEAFQQQAHDLLEKNRGGTLSFEERSMMEEFRQIDHLLTLIKAKARLKLQSKHE